MVYMSLDSPLSSCETQCQRKGFKIKKEKMLPQFVNNKKRKGTSNVILQRLNMIAPPNLALLEKELLCK